MSIIGGFFSDLFSDLNNFVYGPVVQTPSEVDVHERSSLARVGDAIGKSIPLLGPFVGAARIVTGVALGTCSELEALQLTAEGYDARGVSLLASEAESEVARGFSELMPWRITAFEKEQADYESRGFLTNDNRARGNYFYVDPHGGLHYTAQMLYPEESILWQEKAAGRGGILSSPPKDLGPPQGMTGRIFDSDTRTPVVWRNEQATIMSKEKLNDPTPVSYWGLVTDLFKKKG